VAVVATGDHAAKILTPGPVISGWNRNYAFFGKSMELTFLNYAMNKDIASILSFFLIMLAYSFVF
jgi:hypothetical protein